MAAAVDVTGLTVAALTTAGELHNTYSYETSFEPAERSEAKFWSGLPDATGLTLKGLKANWRVPKGYGWGVGNPGGSDAWSPAEARDAAEMSVTAVAVDSGVEITMEADDRAGGEGSYSADLINEEVTSAQTVMALYEEFLALGPSTGQLAIVKDATVASTTFTCSKDDSGVGGAVKLRDNMRIEFADAASGGAVQEAAKILSVDPITGIVILDTAVTLSAGWSVFKYGVYGKTFPTGLDHIVDNGAVSSTIYNTTRTNVPKFNAIVSGTQASPVPYSETSVDAVLTGLSMGSGFTPTELLCNIGVAVEHRKYAGQDRIFPIMGNVLPTTSGGKMDSLTYQFEDAIIPFAVNKNVAPRVMYMLYKPSVTRAYLRKADWLRTGGVNGNPVLNLKPATDTYSYVYIATMIARWNLVCKKLNANGKLMGIRDRQFGDAD